MTIEVSPEGEAVAATSNNNEDNIIVFWLRVQHHCPAIMQHQQPIRFWPLKRKTKNLINWKKKPVNIHST